MELRHARTLLVRIGFWSPFERNYNTEPIRDSIIYLIFRLLYERSGQHPSYDPAADEPLKPSQALYTKASSSLQHHNLKDQGCFHTQAITGLGCRGLLTLGREQQLNPKTLN